MSALKPPVLATWLLGLMDSNAWQDAVAGDLFEDYQRRRSSTWYWCQVLMVVAIAVGKDLRHHWVLALRALAVAVLSLCLAHSLVSELAVVRRVMHMASPLLGWWPSVVIAAALEPFLICGPAGLAVALTHRKRQATMVLLYVVALFLILVCLCANRPHWTPECVVFWESAVFALAGALFGGFLGCAWDGFSRTRAI
jgi:hypothetical protein